MTTSAAELPHPSFDGLACIDWDSTTSILRWCTPIFDSLANEPALLSKLLTGVSESSHLSEMCEGYDFMRKLVLYDDADLGVRLRLHVYRAGFFDRPHNHRWSFASHILRGVYVHRLFGRDDQFDEETDRDALLPILERSERSGSIYALHHTSVHTVQAEDDTISLLVRGPSAKERFLILDRTSRGSFWVYGAAQESSERRAEKLLSREELLGTIGHVKSLLFSAPTDRRSVSGNDGEAES